MVIYLKYYRCRCLRWFKYKFMYHEKEKAATGLEPVTAKPFLPNPYLDYFDKSLRKESKVVQTKKQY